MLPPFWTVISSQAVFLWRHSIQQILSKWLPTSLLTTTLGYGCSWAISFWAKHAPNSKMIALKIVKWIIASKKYILLTLWRMQSQLQVFHFRASFKSDRMTSHKHGLAAKTVSKWRPLKTNFFRIAGTSKDETSMNRKAECLLAIGEDKKVSFLEWPSPLSVGSTKGRRNKPSASLSYNIVVIS